MASRMERYKNKTDKSRATRNKELYSDIYSYDNYTNIEGIADIGKSNQVDIVQVQELLKSRENYQKERKYRRTLGKYEEPKEVETITKRRFPEIEEKNYDIRDVLKEAKENKTPDDKERVLKNTQYDLLKTIDLKKENIDNEDDDLKEMIQTITNTSMLNKINDVDLASSLLSDLKADDTKVGQLDNVKELLDQQEKLKTREVTPNDTNYDHSFFTSSLKLNKSDFEGSESKKSGFFTKFIITVLIVIMIMCMAILIIKALN